MEQIGGSLGRGLTGKLDPMTKPLTADDILPLVACLTPHERVRLLRLIARPAGSDAEAYRGIAPQSDEFSTDSDSLSWDSDGWESVG